MPALGALARGVFALALLVLAGCATLDASRAAPAEARVQAAQSRESTCAAANACALPSAVREMAGQAFASSTPAAPRHHALILDAGTDALLARVHLIRTATTRIDLQTYIFDEDDSSHLVLDELLAAAKRGVKVRLLLDQLSALKRVQTLAALAGAHANLEVRVYNPVLGRARIGYPHYVLAGLCCWRTLNQRMHSKLLLVDAAVAIAGGRNYQDAYYDWDPEFNFRDRDVLVAGPVAREMDAVFLGFWNDARSVPLTRLRDVARHIEREGVPAWQPPPYARPGRAEAMRVAASDPAQVAARLVAPSLPVGPVRYIADPPGKFDHAVHAGDDTSQSLRALIASAEREVLLQTPYLVLSREAQDLFRELHDRDRPPRVRVSTNSLASTDAFIAYALSHKYRRRHLREFGFEIHEYKPFPADAPVDLAATGAALPAFEQAPAPPVQASPRDRRSVVRRYAPPLAREAGARGFARRAVNEPVALKRAGVRIGMHAKSLVVDDRVGVIGTHNFDPRGDHYNTEAAVVIDTPEFAQALAASLRRDMAPENSWVIAPREAATPFTGLEYSLAKIAEYMPVFDFWPVRYATSYEFVPGPECPLPLAPTHPDFHRCHRAVGDFPEVEGGLKSLTTRVFTAFGAGLAPIL